LRAQGLGVRVLGSMDWGNPAECGMFFFSLVWAWDGMGWDGLTSVDYKIYEQVVDVTHRFKSIFYD
jgi:hypothetical protein